MACQSVSYLIHRPAIQSAPYQFVQKAVGNSVKNSLLWLQICLNTYLNSTALNTAHIKFALTLARKSSS